MAGSSLPAMIWSGNTAEKKIALTFDDGPQPRYAPKLLALLRNENVKATFFVVGKEIWLYPELVKAMVKDGHEVANHSFSHARLDRLSKTDLLAEIHKTNQLVYEITHKRPQFFRPPGGRYNDAVIQAVQSQRMSMVMWNVNAGDYSKPKEIKNAQGQVIDVKFEYNRTADQIVDHVLKGCKNGSIVLFHNGGDPTMEAVPKVIAELKKRGYQFVTVSHLVAGIEVAKKEKYTDEKKSEVPDSGAGAGSRISSTYPNRSPETGADRMGEEP